MNIKLSALFVCALVHTLTAQGHDQCQVYYGGLVFPDGARRSLEHGIHWSKTQSEYTVWVRMNYTHRKTHRYIRLPQTPQIYVSGVIN